MSEVRAEVFISGRVQGVWFRQSTRHKADELGISGWVRNLPDGRVQALFEGEKSQVEALINWCWQGPTRAEVKDVRVEWLAPSSEFSGFHVR